MIEIRQNFRVIGIIPARFDSKRLSGKPLKIIGKKTMIQLVTEQAAKAKRLDAVLVATDDDRIVENVKSFGGRVVLTPQTLQSGTDRVAWVAAEMTADIVVNIQGDEPFIDPKAIDEVVKLLEDFPEADMGTLVRPIDDPEVLSSVNTAKVVIAADGSALYFSRSPIPFCRDNNQENLLKGHEYLQHIGLYSFRRDFLQKFSSYGVTKLERIEKLEQLRALEMGARIQVGRTNAIPFGIDTPADLQKARELIRSQIINN